jgi:hypothetical protein
MERWQKWSYARKEKVNILQEFSTEKIIKARKVLFKDEI